MYTWPDLGRTGKTNASLTYGVRSILTTTRAFIKEEQDWASLVTPTSIEPRRQPVLNLLLPVRKLQTKNSNRDPDKPKLLSKLGAPDGAQWNVNKADPPATSTEIKLRRRRLGCVQVLFPECATDGVLSTYSRSMSTCAESNLSRKEWKA